MDKNIKAAVRRLSLIEDAAALKKNKLTICEYHTLCAVLNDLVYKGSASFIQDGIAEWCRRNKLNVEKTMCGYRVYG